MPGWPLLAFWTASIDSVRMVSMLRRSRSTLAGAVVLIAWKLPPIARRYRPRMDLPDFPWPSKFRDWEGLRLAHLDQGDRPPVLFVHREPTWSFLWRQVIPPVLEAGHPCLRRAVRRRSVQGRRARLPAHPPDRSRHARRAGRPAGPRGAARRSPTDPDAVGRQRPGAHARDRATLRAGHRARRARGRRERLALPAGGRGRAHRRAHRVLAEERLAGGLLRQLLLLGPRLEAGLGARGAQL